MDNSVFGLQIKKSNFFQLTQKKRPYGIRRARERQLKGALKPNQIGGQA